MSQYPIVLLCVGLLAGGRTGAQSPRPYSQTVTQNGTRVTVTLTPVDSSKPEADSLRERESVRVQVRLQDAATGSPLAGGSPAAWIDRKPATGPMSAEQCTAKVKLFAEGSSFSRSEVDLTSYFIVIMNLDATLTVVDPRFGYGDTRLLAMVALDGPAEDWSLSNDGSRLYVSVPSANEIVSVDTASWKVAGTVATIPHAAVTALQPDEGYLWVAFGGQEEESGVIAVDPHSLKVVSKLRTGRGYHHLAFSGDSSYLYVTNPEEGTVSVIDTRKLTKVADIPVGLKPSWIAYSELAKAAYVANEGDGKIVVIDGAEKKIRATIQAAPGLGQIRFAPGDRYGLTVNPINNFVYIVDAASNRIVQQGKLDSGPDQIAFTNKQAHIRQRGSDSVLVIALASLGGNDQEISVADFSGGRNPPGETSLSSPADSIVQASGENGVLVANPKDKSIYYYMEGSAAPMGNLSTYGHEPRAILAVDRNLRERSSGLYETTTALPPSGNYMFALFLDQPRVVSCLDLPVGVDPSVAHPVVAKLKVASHVQPSIVAGKAARMEFQLTDAETGRPENGAVDVMVLMVGPSWQRRAIAVANGNGAYSVDFVVPSAGTYNVLLAAPSLGLNYTQYATVEVKKGSN